MLACEEADAESIQGLSPQLKFYHEARKKETY